MAINNMLYEIGISLGSTQSMIDIGINLESSEFVVDGNIDVNDFTKFLKDKYKSKLLRKVRETKKQLSNGTIRIQDEEALDKLIHLENIITSDHLFSNAAKLCYVNAKYLTYLKSLIDFMVSDGITASQFLALGLLFGGIYVDAKEQNKIGRAHV